MGMWSHLLSRDNITPLRAVLPTGRAVGHLRKDGELLPNQVNGKLWRRLKMRDKSGRKTDAPKWRGSPILTRVCTKASWPSHAARTFVQP